MPTDNAAQDPDVAPKRAPPASTEPYETTLPDSCFPDDRTRDLRIVVGRRDSYGISIDMLNDQGEAVGGVTIDYFDDRLKGIVFKIGSDDPAAVCEICPGGVSRDRKLPWGTP